MMGVAGGWPPRTATNRQTATDANQAAYKGYADAIRLLLVLDCRCGLPDKEGCTPLHWAAIKGNGEACTVLVQVRRGAGWRVLNSKCKPPTRPD
jgi:hypothetical protein